MSSNLAAEYGSSVARGIRDADEGAPFGWYDEEGETYGTAAEADSDAALEPVSASDYLEHVLDIRVTFDFGTRDYYGAQLAVTVGGPNVWIDTAARTLTTCWGSDRHVETLPHAFTAALDEVLEELAQLG